MKKVGIIKKLLATCQGNEAKFVVRSLEGKLRIGLADKTLVVALAHAIVLRSMGRLRNVVNTLAYAAQGTRRYLMTSWQLNLRKVPRRSSRSTGTKSSTESYSG